MSDILFNDQTLIEPDKTIPTITAIKIKMCLTFTETLLIVDNHFMANLIYQHRQDFENPTTFRSGIHQAYIGIKRIF